MAASPDLISSLIYSELRWRKKDLILEALDSVFFFLIRNINRQGIWFGKRRIGMGFFGLIDLDRLLGSCFMLHGLNCPVKVAWYKMPRPGYDT